MTEQTPGRSQPLRQLLDRNRTWAEQTKAGDPEYFSRRVSGQQPAFLVLGCSDSRVPIEIVTGAEPGELFVHRNIANIAPNHDLAFTSVLTYAVEALGVQEVIVCGHYGCGGVLAALSSPVDVDPVVAQWVAPIASTARRNAQELNKIDDPAARHRRLVELNVAAQVSALAVNPVVVRARAHRPLPIHGLIYELADGLLTATGYDS